MANLPNSTTMGSTGMRRGIGGGAGAEAGAAVVAWRKRVVRRKRENEKLRAAFV